MGIYGVADGGSRHGWLDNIASMPATLRGHAGFMEN